MTQLLRKGLARPRFPLVTASRPGDGSAVGRLKTMHSRVATPTAGQIGRPFCRRSFVHVRSKRRSPSFARTRASPVTARHGHPSHGGATACAMQADRTEMLRRRRPVAHVLHPPGSREHVECSSSGHIAQLRRTPRPAAPSTHHKPRARPMATCSSPNSSPTNSYRSSATRLRRAHRQSRPVGPRLRRILDGQQRVTATFRRPDGRTLHVRRVPRQPRSPEAAGHLRTRIVYVRYPHPDGRYRIRCRHSDQPGSPVRTKISILLGAYSTYFCRQ